MDTKQANFLLEDIFTKNHYLFNENYEIDDFVFYLDVIQTDKGFIFLQEDNKFYKSDKAITINIYSKKLNEKHSEDFYLCKNKILVNKKIDHFLGNYSHSVFGGLNNDIKGVFLEKYFSVFEQRNLSESIKKVEYKEVKNRLVKI